ncbi:TPA: cell division protein FtsH [Candidatus Sumerlaeota bacterium]|nr:cell division protein FtsH [Candidatus Sumerlaeota bacterium]
MNNRNLKNLALWIAIFLAFALVAKSVHQTDRPEKLPLVELMKVGDEGRIVGEVVDSGGLLKGKYKAVATEAPGITPPTPEKAADKNAPGPGEKLFETEYMGTQDQAVLDWARKNNIQYKAQRTSEIFSMVLLNVLLPVVIMVVLWIFLMRQFQSGNNKAMSFGKSRAKLVTDGQTKVMFADVAGIDEVKEELMEIIQFLKDPDRFSRLGGKIPKGALLYGPPGTGKTLIAKAVAGEASVPFFSISGSDFVEMFVGVGASRVRDLFEQGKKARPCLIYIDEIDAVGRSRFAGIGGGHDEREQTLNQLLVELDGFNSNEGVIVMASTNRPDVLDPALLRPGRFDRQIRVDLPDLVGREKILMVHTKPLKISTEISLKTIAKGTPGFSGADLANLANEAALLAARKGKEVVEMDDLEEAKDRVLMGPERRSLVMTEKERTNTAYHEAGHALIAKLTNSTAHRVHKVTIIPRGRALGLTSILPEQDMLSQSRVQLKNTILCLMGGRAAEDIVFDEMTTGAANDLQRCTEIAHRMVCEFGMSDKLGPRTFGEPTAQVFLGRDIGRQREYSEDTARIIDTEVQDLLVSGYADAKHQLEGSREALERISQALLERETLDSDQLDMLIAGEPLPPLLEPLNGKNGNGDNSTPSAPASEPTLSPAANELPLEGTV